MGLVCRREVLGVLFSPSDFGEVDGQAEISLYVISLGLAALGCVGTLDLRFVLLLHR